jgi:site-specific recombinase XerD
LTEFAIFLEARQCTLNNLTSTHIDEFLQATTALGLSKAHLSIRVCAARGFLRYLDGEGWLVSDLATFVEGPRIYRESKVPPHFTWDEVLQLIKSVRGYGPAALRDRALLVVLCVYGLRSQEAAQLTLDDIDWSRSVLTIPQRKMNSPLVLPLVPLAAEVLGHYLRSGRPADAPFRALFLTPRGRPFINGMAVTNRIHGLVTQAGLKGGRGVHAIRRAVGTRLVEQGLGLTEIACILGHASPNSGRVYLRLSMELLRDVAGGYGELL